MTEPETLTLRREPLTSARARELIAALNGELSAMYREPGANHFSLDPSETEPGRGAFFVAYLGGRAVGCGAVRLIDAGTAELKRMYVDPEIRGRGIGRRLVAGLEEEATALGARSLVLETGTRQAAALALYERCGFRRIPLYGEYARSPETSICLGKSIAPDGGS